MTDGRTNRRTDGGDCNIPDAFLKKRGDNNFTLMRGDREVIQIQLKAGRRWPNIECWLGSFAVFQGFRTSNSCVLLQRGGGVRACISLLQFYRMRG